MSAAPTCNGSGIQVARSDDAPRINGSDAQDRKGTTADQSSAEPWAAPRSYGGTSGAPAAAAVNVGQPSRAFVIAGCVRVYFCWYGSTAVVFQIWRFSCLWPRASKWAAFFGRVACRSVYRGCRQCAVCVGRARGRWMRKAEMVAVGGLLADVNTLGSSLEPQGCGSRHIRACRAYNCENGTNWGRIAATLTDVIAAAPCAAFAWSWRCTPPQRSTS